MSVDKWAQVQRLNKGSQLPHEKAMDEGSNLSDMCASVASTGSCDTSIGSATQSAKLINTTEEDSAVVGAGVVPCEDKAIRDVKDIESATQCVHTQELKGRRRIR